MGDRFYTERDNIQSKYFGRGKHMPNKTEKPKRILKKDIIAEFESLVGQEVPGLDRMTVASIQHLHTAIVSYGKELVGD